MIRRAIVCFVVLWSGLFSVALTPQSSSVPVVVAPSGSPGGAMQDTYVDQTTPFANYGGSGLLYVGEKPMNDTDRKIGFIEFDLDTLTIPVEINRVFLRFFMIAHDGMVMIDNFRIHAISEPWNETLVTWTNQPAYSRRSYHEVPGNTYQGKVNAFHQVEITTIFKSWVNGSLANNGIAIESNNNYGNMYFASMNATNATRRPQIVFIPVDHVLSAPSITAPLANNPVSGTFTITWSAANDSNLDPVEYYLYLTKDDWLSWQFMFTLPVGESLNTTQYEWNTWSHADGSDYRLKIVAVCSEELTSSSEIQVTVQNTPPPSVASFPVEMLALLLICTFAGIALMIQKRHMSKE
jgi:hypothetical protein